MPATLALVAKGGTPRGADWLNQPLCLEGARQLSVDLIDRGLLAVGRLQKEFGGVAPVRVGPMALRQCEEERRGVSERADAAPVFERKHGSQFSPPRHRTLATRPWAKGSASDARKDRARRPAWRTNR
jgi:hypothetical protein